MTRAYKLLRDRFGVKAGEVVFAARGWDYGLASDDTRMTGIEHISVTRKRNGDYPTFTVPLNDLEEHDVLPLERLTAEHVRDVCGPGQGAATCRYLVMGSGGWECAKHTELADTIDARADMVAWGDNCEGREGSA